MPSSEAGKKSNALWNLFTSVKLTLGLLIVLAVTSIFGTLIPQQEGAMELAEELGPGLVSLLSSLQLFDMYHSVWFRFIIGTLALNLIICSLDRFPGAWKRFKAAPRLDRSKPFEDVPSQRDFSAPGKIGEALPLAAGILKSRYKRFQQKETENEAVLYAEKGRFSHLGVYVVHLSVLIILIGSIVGSLFGFEAYVNIPEGESIDKVRLRKGQAFRPLPFEVRCDRFSVEFYDNGAPKEYRSDLVFLENGKTTIQGSLRVNHPITFEGITFYQASYGSLPGNKAHIDIRREGDPLNAHLDVEIERPYDLPAGGGQFMVFEARADFMRMGPAVQVAVKPPEGEEVRFWIFKNIDLIQERFPGFFEKFPKFNAGAYKPYVFSLQSIEARHYTGLQVSRDPGVPLVWTGFFLIMIGLFVTFFTSHRSIWIQMSKTKRGLNIRVAGRANKNPVGLERELDRLAATIKEKAGNVIPRGNQ
jgi:cytochrome c biogenesis protein